MLEILSWIFLAPAVIGAFIMSGHPKRKDIFIANILFTITNGFGLLFMILNFHWGYFVFNIIMTGISIRGIWLNRRIKVGICKVCKKKKKLNRARECYDCWREGIEDLTKDL